MKKIILFFALFCAILTLRVSAQVTIPDANFRAKLKEYYPTCFDTNDVLDTICAANAPRKELYIFDSLLHDPDTLITFSSIDGVHYFKQLEKLTVNTIGQHFDMTPLTKIPENLKVFYMNCLVTYMPTLPSTLKVFNCSGNLLTSLPALPSGLDTLICGSNQSLSSLPTLPSNLKMLDCFYCIELRCLPVLPANLTKLNVEETQITCLPNIPVGIAANTNLPVCTQSFNPNLCDIAIPTGIAEKVSRRLEVYPNPLEGEVLTVLNMRGASAKLLSLEGKELRTWSNIGEQISLQNIASGMYLLEVLHEGQRRVAKVVVR